MRNPSFWRSLIHAVAGLRHILRTQRNARIQLVAAILAAGFCLWLRVSMFEASLVVLSIGGVFAAEAFNTAIETIVDLASPEYHDLARIAKDVAAAAVLIAAMAALLVGLCVLAPPLWRRLAEFA